MRDADGLSYQMHAEFATLPQLCIYTTWHYKKPKRDFDELKQRLIDTWDRIRQGIIDEAIDQWPGPNKSLKHNSSFSERRRREHRGAVGAEWGGLWGGVSPFPLGVGCGEGAVPPPQKIFGLFILK